MKAPIVLITNSCPFRGEVFLKNELDHIPADRQVFLFPVLPGKTHSLPDWDKPHIRVMAGGAFPNTADKLLALGHALTAPFRHGELREIFHKLSPARNFLKAAKFAFLSDSRARAIRRCLKKEKLDAPIFYSYWFYESAYAAARLRRHYCGSRFVSRCHGYDLYEIRHPGGYLPFRPFLTHQADALCPISQDGVDYVNARFPKAGNLRLSRLGTMDHGLCEAEKSDILTIVSCSNLVDVKRVDLLIRGLALCKQPVRWFHFGDGPLMAPLRQQAETLPSHIQWQFMGNVPNAELMAFYKTTYADAFLNVSSSEGVPVSVMEALSFGIPAIATDVGGTHEIVINGHNGLLLSCDPSPADIAHAITQIVAMDGVRANARFIWQDRCSAAENYSKFYQEILINPKYNK